MSMEEEKEERKIVSDPNMCSECEKQYNGTNKLKLSCPACKSYSRCKECFKKNNYNCEYCLESWGVKNGDDLICPDLDYGTPRAADFVTIRVRNERKATTEFLVNKNKTFRVLMGMIKFGLYQRKAELEDTTPDVIARAFKKAKKTPSVKFMQGDQLLLEDSPISTLGNNAIIDQKVRYDGGCNL